MYLLISHQTGATFSTLSAHIIEFTAVIKLSIATQIASEKTPTFIDLDMHLGTEASTGMQAMKLAMGTRGYVESMLRISTYEAGRAIYIFFVRTCLCHCQI